MFLVAASVQSPRGALGQTEQGAQQIITGLIQGFGLAICIFFASATSGGHLNPVVSFALWIVDDDANIWDTCQ